MMNPIFYIFLFPIQHRVSKFIQIPNILTYLLPIQNIFQNSNKNVLMLLNFILIKSSYNTSNYYFIKLYNCLTAQLIFHSITTVNIFKISMNKIKKH